MTTQTLFARVDTAEQRLCRFANRGCQRKFIRSMFQVVSRLGDGVFWYAIIVMMPLFMGLHLHQDGLIASAHMLMAAAVGLVTYKLLKRKLVRERPFISFDAIECAMPPLDRYSFPSGHTLHAVLFTSISTTYVPELSIILVPFTMLIALSRVVLGLHYPTDVLVGALLGWMVARLSWFVIPL